MHDPAIIEQHRPLIRKIAAESMVLLKNISAQLPLPQGCELALFGYGAYRLIKGGAGSADIFSGSTVEVVDALLDAEKSGRLVLDKTLLEKYRNDENSSAATPVKAWTEPILTVISGYPLTSSGFLSY